MTTARLAARLMAPMFPGFAELQCRRFLAGKEEKCLNSHRYARSHKLAGFIGWTWGLCSSCGMPGCYRKLAKYRHLAIGHVSGLCNVTL